MKNTEMEKINIFIRRLKKLGINVEISLNTPWIYMHSVNGKRVTEKFEAEHGFTLAFRPLRPNQELKFTDIKEIFKIIRKYK